MCGASPPLNLSCAGDYRGSTAPQFGRTEEEIQKSPKNKDSAFVYITGTSFNFDEIGKVLKELGIIAKIPDAKERRERAYSLY
jgi:hypothetical protein